MNSADSFALIHLSVANRVAPEQHLIDLSRVQRPARAADHSEFVRICSWCQRVADGAEWVRAGGRPQNQPADPRPITHGICPSCLSRMLRNERLTA